MQLAVSRRGHKAIAAAVFSLSVAALAGVAAGHEPTLRFESAEVFDDPRLPGVTIPPPVVQRTE